MPNDLDIIAQIEEWIGRKLPLLDKIEWNSVGYQSDKKTYRNPIYSTTGSNQRNLPCLK
jgi:hypothetical protein